jgi:tRNA nucleotidyltransferase (CCA-adding enzyme)
MNNTPICLNKPIKFYLVGGAVRDELMGTRVNDFDYSVEAPSYEAMRAAIIERGGTIFLETPQYFTIRAKVPKFGAADFVLCRKEGAYTDGRRPDSVEIGTLYDDLARRDFTINAIAKNEEGNYIDFFGGIQDIRDGLIRCVGNPLERFTEDYLRIFRALRFSITKNMQIGHNTQLAIENIVGGSNPWINSISVERIYEELRKMFAANSMSSIRLLDKYHLLETVLAAGIKLEPALKS